MDKSRDTMTHRIFWIVALSLLWGGALARHEDCEVPPKVNFATVRIEDENDRVRAIYACHSGYTLEGETELICDLDTDEWNTDPPTCVKIQSEDEDDGDTSEQSAASQKKKKFHNIQEDPLVSPDYAESLDMSCVSAKVKAPEIRNGFVQKYDRRRKGEHVFIVAFYSCNDNFELENAERNAIYCSKKEWVGQLPNCIALAEYDEEDEYDESYDDGGEEEEETKPTVVLPPPQATASTEVEYTVKVGGEETDASQSTPESATDINIVVEPTRDPYAPRVLDQSCGPEKAGCEHKCDVMLYPGEHEPRMVCSCYSGFTLDPYDFKRCHDNDECDINNGGCEQVCKNTPGSYECACNEGLQIETATGNTCVDIDECESPEIAQHCPGGCENTPGSYVCHQQPGEEEPRRDEVESQSEVHPQLNSVQCEEGFRQSSDGSCEDIDECTDGTARCENCRNTHGSYDCVCPAGYELADDEVSCVDVNECEAYANQEQEGGPRLCSHECENTAGAFVCRCGPNHHLDGDQRTCVLDTCAYRNEPESSKPRCSYYCEDSADGPVCKCPATFELDVDKATCVPSYSDACQERGGSERCFPGTCVNVEGDTYKCNCPTGFSDKGYFCEDVNECTEGKHNCSHTCFNTEGSFVCSCPIGFRELARDLSKCEDIDECAEGNVCGDKVCRNTEGGYGCVCDDGKEPDESGRCASEYLCADNNGGCSHECSPSSGQVQCRCPAEMKLASDGVTCVHEDPCADGNNGCSQICNSQLEGACSCERGYELQGDGKTCRDYDECTDNNGGCEQICVNSDGSFSCACEFGFELEEDLRTCIDTDECEQSIHDCSHYCVNVVGGYECSCPAGFVLGPNKKTCIDVDECSDSSTCSHICRNTLGSFVCECPPGMVLDGDRKSCVDGDFCNRLQPQCSHYCENIDSGFQCACPIGFTLGSDSLTCVDANECVVDNGGCSYSCTNVEGSFRCLCPESAKLAEDGKSCVNVNECDVSNGGCAHYCLNTPNGRSCECSDGYALQPDGVSCAESDPCRRNNGGCEQLCEASGHGGAKCDCRPGFNLSTKDNSTCNDIDECQMENVCPQQTCSNTPGGYECICPSGYSRNLVGQCVDINECEYQNGGCPGECANLPGSFECKCPRGLRLGSDRKSCVEVKDHCEPFRPPKYGEIHCTRLRHKAEFYYKTKCSVWCVPGYKLEGPAIRHCNASGQWDDFENHCVPAVCPRLAAPAHGNILPANCLLGKAYVGERCLLHCQPGYMPIGKATTVCTADQVWSSNSTFDCVPIGTGRSYSVSRLGQVGNRRLGTGPVQRVDGVRPFIKCPRNTTVLLPAGHTTAHIILQKPKTNMDYRYVESFPEWSRNLQAHLGAGVHVITFRGRDPSSRRGAACRTVITVKRTEPPKVTFCPTSFEVALAGNQDKRSVSWQEPQFQGLNNIKTIHKSNMPGQLFGEGVHRVAYEAVDGDGLTARCEFNIVVKAAALQSMPYYSYPQVQDRSAKLMVNHDSYIICAGQAPVKLYGNKPINLPPNCYVKNIRVGPIRQYTRRRLITHRWTPFRSF